MMQQRYVVKILLAGMGLLSVLVLPGCGNNAPNRLGGGTAGGAATGATFGLIGGPLGVLVGGAIGGGIGALTAANTTPKQLNLGPPPWQGGQPSNGAPQAQPMPNSHPYQQSSQPYQQQPQQLQPQAYEGGAYGAQPYQAPAQPVQSQPLPPPRQ
jgi:hypothetical protein